MRRVIRVWLGAIGVAFACSVAMAQGYPAKPIRVIIPNPPGGSLDIVARLVGPKMTELSGQAVLIDHRPGADSNIGTELAARAPGDGYTALFH